MTPAVLAARGSTVGALRRRAAAALAAAGVPSPEADAAALTAYACGIPYADFGARSLDGAPAGAEARLAPLVERRSRREPLQLIVGTAPFLGLELDVAAGVFIPRPETEGLALLAEGAPGRPPSVVVDLYAGIGPLAVYFAARFPGARVIAVERDPRAAGLTARNAARHGAAVEVLECDAGAADLAARLPDADLIVANPPYIRTADVAALPPEVRDWEPRAALDGGADGLDAYAGVVALARARLAPGGVLAVEIGEDAAAGVAALCGGLEDVEVRDDLAGRNRYLLARKGSRV